MRIVPTLRGICLVAAAIACPALQASATPFFSIEGGHPYTLPGPEAPPPVGFKGFAGATLTLSESAIVTFTYLGQSSNDRVIFTYGAVPPVTTYFDHPDFLATTFAGPGGSIRLFFGILDGDNAMSIFFSIPTPDGPFPYSPAYLNGFGPEGGFDADFWVGSADGNRRRNHLDSVIFAFDDGSRGTDNRTFGDMVWLVTLDPQTVPEPASLSLLVAGLVGFAAARRHRN